jgi:hypothetical protein
VHGASTIEAANIVKHACFSPVIDGFPIIIEEVAYRERNQSRREKTAGDLLRHPKSRWIRLRPMESFVRGHSSAGGELNAQDRLIHAPTGLQR